MSILLLHLPLSNMIIHTTDNPISLYVNQEVK